MLLNWKKIPNYENYLINEDGEVISLSRTVVSRGKTRTTKERQINPWIDKNHGYLKVVLCKDGKPKMFFVHRLVALVFIPNPENKSEVNHLDSDRANCNVKNLVWATPKENSQHAQLNNQVLINKRREVYQVSLDGFLLYCHPSITQAANFNGLSASHISRCLSGDRKSHGGYIWKS